MRHKLAASERLPSAPDRDGDRAVGRSVLLACRRWRAPLQKVKKKLRKKKENEEIFSETKAAKSRHRNEVKNVACNALMSSSTRQDRGLKTEDGRPKTEDWRLETAKIPDPGTSSLKQQNIYAPLWHVDRCREIVLRAVRHGRQTFCLARGFTRGQEGAPGALLATS